MFGIIKKMFIVLLSSIVNASKHTKFLSLSDQKNVKSNLLLLSYILINTIKNYSTIHLPLH